MKRYNRTSRTHTEKKRGIRLFALSLTVALLLAGCGTQSVDTDASNAETLEAKTISVFGSAETSEVTVTQAETAVAEAVQTEIEASVETAETDAIADAVDFVTSVETEAAPVETATESIVLTPISPAENGILGTEEFFSQRDLTQTPDLSEAVALTVEDGQDLHITEAGTYVLSGTASEMTVCIEAPEDAKVQLVLSGLNITNSAAPCIWVSTADKVFLTVSEDSTLCVSDEFGFASDEKADAVVFSRSDLTLNGTATLTIDSVQHGIVCKDDLRVTGGTYLINTVGSAVKANDSIRIADGSFTITAGSDGIHSENSEDGQKGWLYISGGILDITASDDGLHANSALQIDGGTFAITALEGIEATCVQINDGLIRIESSDDGINTTAKTTEWNVLLEINGGEITILMGAGDTDGLDSNGDLTINGGTIDITGSSTVDYDGTGTLNGGILIVNGQQTDTLPNQMGGGRGFGHGF